MVDVSAAIAAAVARRGDEKKQDDGIEAAKWKSEDCSLASTKRTNDWKAFE